MGTQTLLSLSSLFLLVSAVTAVTADDAAVMSEFLKTLTSPPSGWSSKTSFCSWKGIGCDSTDTHVTSINLKSSSLTGTLPSDLSSLTQLTTLSLQENSLSGALPSLADLSSLQEVYLDQNNFTSIPSGCFRGLTSLKILSISKNGNLEPWSIPGELSESTNLVTLYADNAKIAGSIPDFLGRLPNLQDLRLSYNNLTGTLPSSFGASTISNLWLNNQDVGLSGTIDVLSSMEFLYQVWLHKNHFTGPIPDLTKCTSLFDLQLRDNDLTGLVPESLLSSIPTLRNVSLDNNKLQGPVPSNPENITLTYGSINKFCKEEPGPCDGQVNVLLAIAGALGYPAILADSWTGNDACASWTYISCQNDIVDSVTFSKRGFSGTISPSFANLTLLRSLRLNDNNLTGSIPVSLTTLSKLETFDVSNNNLSGTVPLFRSGIKVDTAGNPLLGTNSSGDDAGGSTGSNTNPTSGGSSGGLIGSSVSPGIIVGIVLAALIFVGVVLFVLYKCYFNKRHKKFKRVENPENGTEISKLGILNGGNNGYGGLASELQSQSSGDHSDFHVFTGGNVAMPIQVLLQVTNNFSEDNILGKGGFGIVYRGELQDGSKVAVKRMESGAMGTKGLNEFQAEIAVLTKVRHRHLVALLGYCVNGSERLLVYEYMPQGTLTQHLFEWKERGFSPLTWKQRVTIALDVARGVEYLHSLAQQSFIHRDLKPYNILLGDDMRAKVADFGLVKNAPDGKYSVETRLAGTFGYLAPEYAATGRVTTKVDVYAFGVVLMELIAGRRALDNTVPDESSHLVTWFRRILINRENIPKAIDRTLNPDEETMESIYKVAELAGHCTAREPYQRPDMGHAVNVLGPLVQQWKPSTQEEESGTGTNMDLSDMLRQWQSGEGPSMMFDSMSSHSNTQSSIPANAFSNSVRSTDCR